MRRTWPYRTADAREKDERYLFEPQTNVEFGKVRVYNRLTDFLASFIAISVVRLPIDLVVWALWFGVGLLVGRHLWR